MNKSLEELEKSGGIKWEFDLKNKPTTSSSNQNTYNNNNNIQNESRLINYYNNVLKNQTELSQSQGNNESERNVTKDDFLFSNLRKQFYKTVHQEINNVYLARLFIYY